MNGNEAGGSILREFKMKKKTVKLVLEIKLNREQGRPNGKE